MDKEAWPALLAWPNIVRDVSEESPDSSNATDKEAGRGGEVSYDRLEGQM